MMMMAWDVRVFGLLSAAVLLAFMPSQIHCAELGLEFIQHPVKQCLGIPGSIVALSCAVNLPVDDIQWHLNHHAIPSEDIILAEHAEITKLVEGLSSNGSRHCIIDATEISLGNAAEEENAASERTNLKNKYMMGIVNDKSYLLVFLSENISQYAHQEGIYQCVASLGTISLVSSPSRLEVAKIAECPGVLSQTIVTAVDSSVRIPCGQPESTPPATITFTKNGAPLEADAERSFIVTAEGDLLLFSVSADQSGDYRCSVTNSELKITRICPAVYKLHVVPVDETDRPLQLISPKPGLVLVTEGDNVELHCITSLGLKKSVTWWTRSLLSSKPQFDAELGTEKPADISEDSHLLRVNEDLPDAMGHSNITGDSLLHLQHVTSRHSGRYTCHAESRAPLTVEVQLYVQAAPRVVAGLRSMAVGEGEELRATCAMTGQPAPQLSWFSNGRLLQPGPGRLILPHGELILHSVSKQDAGVLQCFGHNAVGSASSHALLTVTPATVLTLHKISSNSEESKKGMPDEQNDAVPPSRPTVTRVADDTVRLDWERSPSAVRFYKIQYRIVDEAMPEQASAPLGPQNPWEPRGHERRRWRTDDVNIAHDRNSWLLSGLTPNTTYKFRVAAVFANDKQRVSSSSKRFLLQHQQPLLPPDGQPDITDARWVTDAVDRQAEVLWRYSGSRVTPVDGFYILSRPAKSSEAFVKRQFLGGDRRSIVLTDLHLSDDSHGVELRVQAFNLAGSSLPSPPKILLLNYRSHEKEAQAAASGPAVEPQQGPPNSDGHLWWTHDKMEENRRGQDSDEVDNSDEQGVGTDAPTDEERDKKMAATWAKTSQIGVMLFSGMFVMVAVGLAYGLWVQRDRTTRRSCFKRFLDTFREYEVPEPPPPIVDSLPLPLTALPPVSMLLPALKATYSNGQAKDASTRVSLTQPD